MLVFEHGPEGVESDALHGPTMVPGVAHLVSLN